MCWLVGKQPEIPVQQPRCTTACKDASGSISCAAPHARESPADLFDVDTREAPGCA